MARHKDVEWNLPDGKPNASGGNTHSWEAITAAVLMDIRDELKQLNNTMNCHNTRSIPQTLKRIDRRIASAVPLRKAKRKATR
jgi:hypothetical protein